MKQQLPTLTSSPRASRFRRLALLGVLALGSAMPATAAIVFTFPTATTAGSIVITEDINYTITTAGTFYVIAFDEWVTDDGVRTRIEPAVFSATPLSYALNGGSPAGVPLEGVYDQVSFNAGGISVNDGYFSLNSGVTVAVNDVFTLRAATYNLQVGSVPAGFNPQAAQSFTGNTFLVNPSAVKLSADTPAGAVPEPSQLVLLTGALLPLALRRRRK